MIYGLTIYSLTDLLRSTPTLTDRTSKWRAVVETAMLTAGRAT